MKLPLFLKKYFWEVNFSELDTDTKAGYIALRLLEHGDIKAVRWLFSNIPVNELKKIIKKQRGLSPRSLNFWSSFFNINLKNLECLKKSYQKKQKTHWPY